MMDAQGSEPTTPDAPTKAEAWWQRALPPPQHRMQWTVGVLLMLLATGAVVANLRLPVLTFTALGTAAQADWSDLRNPGGLAYEQRLLVWPLVACALAAVAGVLVTARAYLARERWVGPLTPPVLWLLAFAGFLLALTGTRWLGFFLARQAETDSALVRLHAVPYVNLAVGLLLLAGATWRLVRLVRGAGGPQRWAALSAAAVGLGLLSLPLLPFAHWSFGGGATIHLDEFTLAAMGAQGSAAAPQALGWARMMSWGALYTSVAACLAWQVPQGPTPRAIGWLRRVAMANVLFVVAGAVFLARFHRGLPDLRPGVVVDPNPFLHLAFLAVAVLWWFHLRSLVAWRRRSGQ